MRQKKALSTGCKTQNACCARVDRPHQWYLDQLMRLPPHLAQLLSRQLQRHSAWVATPLPPGRQRILDTLVRKAMEQLMPSKGESAQISDCYCKCNELMRQPQPTDEPYKKAESFKLVHQDSSYGALRCCPPPMRREPSCQENVEERQTEHIVACQKKTVANRHYKNCKRNTCKQIEA